jgi:hypothetical protein
MVLGMNCGQCWKRQCQIRMISPSSKMAVVEGADRNRETRKESHPKLKLCLHSFEALV